MRVWVGTVRNGAYRVDPTARVAVPVRETDAPPSRPRTEGIPAIAEAGPGEVWLGTRDQGIIAVDTVTLHTRRIRHDPRSPTSLPDDIIQCLFRDRAGLIWTGTMRSLTRHDARQLALSTVFGISSRPDGISDRDVHSVLSMPDGRVWLGLGNNGVDVLDPLGVRVAALRPNPDRPDTALPRARIESLSCARHDSGIRRPRCCRSSRCLHPCVQWRQ
jgi:ligand-binding sensor domain-containing protein